MKTETDATTHIRVGFGSQKGGIGKSTIAEVLASYLYYEKNIKLLIMDCDYAQHSFYRLRERDKKAVEESTALQEKLKAYIRKKAFIPYTESQTSGSHKGSRRIHSRAPGRGNFCCNL